MKNKCRVYFVCLVLVFCNKSLAKESKSTIKPLPATVRLISDTDTLLPLKLQTRNDSVQYALGTYIGTNLLSKGFVSIDLDYFLAGLNDLYHNNKLLISDSNIVSILNKFQIENQAKRGKGLEEELFSQLKDKPDVGKLPSGVQYLVIKQGTGQRPLDSDTIVFNMQGVLVNGTEFENTFSKNTPSVTVPKNLIPGLNEAVQLMQVGSTWKIFLPASQAYGEKGSGMIPPNNALVILLELKEIRKKQ